MVLIVDISDVYLFERTGENFPRLAWHGKNERKNNK